jgi:hypothetical protein
MELAIRGKAELGFGRIDRDERVVVVMASTTSLVDWAGTGHTAMGRKGSNQTVEVNFSECDEDSKSSI